MDLGERRDEPQGGIGRVLDDGPRVGEPPLHLADADAARGGGFARDVERRDRERAREGGSFGARDERPRGPDRPRPGRVGDAFAPEQLLDEAEGVGAPPTRWTSALTASARARNVSNIATSPARGPGPASEYQLSSG